MEKLMASRQFDILDKMCMYKTLCFLETTELTHIFIKDGKLHCIGSCFIGTKEYLYFFIQNKVTCKPT